MICLDAIRIAFGVRWAQAKSGVWSTAEHQISERLGVKDVVVRLSDVDFALATPGLEPREAQGLAVSISKSILEHFLGDASARHVLVRIATGFVNQDVICRSIAEKDLLSALGAEDGLGRALQHSLLDAETSEDDAPTTLRTSSGHHLQYSSCVEPIFDLSRWAVAGYRIDPKITYQLSGAPLSAVERRHLLPADVEAIDNATLQKGLERIACAEGKENRTTVVLSISFLTVSNTKARNALFDGLGPVKSDMAKSIIWEITDFDPGVPPGRLQDCITWLAPFSRAVFARADASTLSAVSLHSACRNGLVFKSPETVQSDNDTASWLLSMTRMASKRSPTLIAANLCAKSHLGFAKSAGFTHATVRRVA